jgi:tryptophan synthase beta chain
MELNTRFGEYGGCFVPETLMVALEELESAFLNIFPNPAFQKEFQEYLTTYAGKNSSYPM